MSYLVITASNTGVHVGVCHVVCWSGQFLNDVGRHADGAVSYVTASQLSADDFELIFNTASALRSHLISLLCTVCQRALFVRYLTRVFYSVKSLPRISSYKLFMPVKNLLQLSSKEGTIPSLD